MDFKGITWAGNIYEKFEAMCLEVEEVMYEDTVKYVENQVQKVGVSVKKFYSEVMQDLLPPSSVDPEKVTAEDLSLKPYTHTDINKKPKLSIIDNHRNLKKKETEEDISGLTAEKTSLSVPNDANYLRLLPPKVVVENTRSELCSTRNKKLGAYRRPIGIKRISQNNQSPKVSPPVRSLSEDHMNKTKSTELNSVRHDDGPGEAMNENAPISIASVESLVSDKILSAQCLRQEKSESECTSNISSVGPKKESSEEDSSSCCLGLPTQAIGASAEGGISFSKTSSSFRSNACDVTTSYEDEFRQNGLFSETNKNIGSHPCDVESVDAEVIASYQDNSDMEVIENEDVVGERPETFDPVENSKLEETCILVEGDKLHFVSQTTHKHKSYKKKIREALVSKLRSTKKQHHQYLSDYKDLGPGVVVDSDEGKLRARESLESDWELL